MRTLSTTTHSEADVLKALERPTQDLASFRATVRPILAAVRREGDAAARRFTEQFDGVRVQDLRVPLEKSHKARTQISREDLDSLLAAAANIRRFHEEKPTATDPVETQAGVRCWRELRALDSVGLYVPGGSAPLASTVLMLAIPATLARVGRIALCTPPQKDGNVPNAILAAADITGVHEIYAVGGAQAIAAMAYGTESIAKVAKIVGPGNAYVTAAKAEVSIDPDGAAIDMLAGPSELLVIADDSADPRYVAADLLSQAEHDPLSQVTLLVTSESVWSEIQREITTQVAALPRRDIARAALECSRAVLVRSIEEAVAICNAYAPEHLSIQTADPGAVVAKIRNAGSVFVGPYSPQTVGDYCSGTNHVLPTGGTARTFSGVTVRTFQKTVTVQQLTREGLATLRPVVTRLARMEELEAHARAIEIRFSNP